MKEQATVIEEAREKLPKRLKVLKNIAFVEHPEASLGIMAFYAAVVSGMRVGVAIEVKDGWAVMSLRAKDPRVDLNSLLRNIAPSFKGHGGGHRSAAGARVPLENLTAFLSALDESL